MPLRHYIRKYIINKYFYAILQSIIDNNELLWSLFISWEPRVLGFEAGLPLSSHSSQNVLPKKMGGHLGGRLGGHLGGMGGHFRGLGGHFRLFVCCLNLLIYVSNWSIMYVGWVLYHFYIFLLYFFSFFKFNFKKSLT